MRKHIPEKLYRKLWKLRPVVSTDCVAARGNEIMLIKRAHEPFSGYWCLPGGMMNVGETIEQTAVREVFEETGAVAKIVSLIGVYSGPHRDPRGTSLTTAFLMKFVKMKGNPDQEVSEVKFFPTNKIPKSLGFDHANIIKDALKLLRSKGKKKGRFEN